MGLTDMTDDELLTELGAAMERLEQAKRDVDQALIACFDRTTLANRRILPYVDCRERMLRYRVAEARRRAALQ